MSLPVAGGILTGVVGGTGMSISGTPGFATIGSAYSFTPATSGTQGTKTFAYSGTTLATYGMSFSTTTGAITAATVTGSAATITGTITLSDTSGNAPVVLPISFGVYAALGPTTASFQTSASPGTAITSITGLSGGETVTTISPNDGRIAFTSGGAVTVGLTSSSAGTTSYTFTTSAGRTLGMAITASSAVFTQPYNYHIVEMGDSRVAQGFGQAGTYAGGGRGASTALGPAGFLGPLSGHLLRYPSADSPNAGGGGQTVEQILANPRVGTNTVDLTLVAAYEAATIVFYAGTNSIGGGSASIGPGGTARVAITDMIASLTNAATVWPASGSVLPLYGGQAKNVIILTDTPRGVAADGTINNNLSGPNAALFEGFATWIKGFDYAAGGNSRVAVFDTFHDPLILDGTSGANYYPLPGLFADGLHPAPQAVWYMGQVGADKITGLFTNATPYYEVPVSSTASTFFNSNPLLAIGGVSSASALPTGATFTGGLFAGGTTVLAYGTSGTSGTGGNGTYALSSNALLTCTNGLASTSSSNFVVNTTAGSNIVTLGVWNGTVGVGATITGCPLPVNTDFLSSGTWTGCNLDITYNVIDASNGNEMVMRLTSASTPSNPPAFTIRQYSSSGTNAANDISTSTYRMTASMKFTSPNPNNLVSFEPLFVINGSGGFLEGSGPLVGSRLGFGNIPGYYLNLKNSYSDLSSTYKYFTTPTVTGTDQSIAGGTHPTSAYAGIFASFQASVATDVTLYVRNVGLKVVTD